MKYTYLCMSYRNTLCSDSVPYGKYFQNVFLFMLFFYQVKWCMQCRDVVITNLDILLLFCCYSAAARTVKLYRNSFIFIFPIYFINSSNYLLEYIRGLAVIVHLYTSRQCSGISPCIQMQNTTGGAMKITAYPVFHLTPYTH